MAVKTHDVLVRCTGLNIPDLVVNERVVLLRPAPETSSSTYRTVWQMGVGPSAGDTAGSAAGAAGCTAASKPFPAVAAGREEVVWGACSLGEIFREMEDMICMAETCDSDGRAREDFTDPVIISQVAQATTISIDRCRHCGQTSPYADRRSDNDARREPEDCYGGSGGGKKLN